MATSMQKVTDLQLKAWWRIEFICVSSDYIHLVQER